jgi:hypothetical protein
MKIIATQLKGMNWVAKLSSQRLEQEPVWGAFTNNAPKTGFNPDGCGHR